MTNRAKVTSPGLNVHRRPGAAGEVIDAIKEGDVVTVYDERMLDAYRWVRISPNNAVPERWVDARFLEALKPPQGEKAAPDYFGRAAVGILIAALCGLLAYCGLK